METLKNFYNDLARRLGASDMAKSAINKSPVAKLAVATAFPQVDLERRPTVAKTFVVPDFGAEQTLIDPETGMAQDYQPTNSNDLDLASLAMASKRNVPTASNSELEKALQARRGWGYSMAKALAGLPQQEGYGSWLGNFGKAFGSAYSAPTDAWVNKELALAKEGRENAKAYKDEDMKAVVMSLLGE
jgi:hypothetical protein